MAEAPNAPSGEPDLLGIGNGIVADGMDVFRENAGLLIDGNRIAGIESTEKILKASHRFIDVKGRLILPGLLNAHHHLYSYPAPGIQPLGRTESFVNILENLWWPLDAAMDEESVYYSALLGIIDSIKHGTTMLFDHHASMSFVRGSLASIESAFKEAGIKGTLCFETSDRRGSAEALEHMAENVDFYNKHRDSKVLKGLFGLHANLTLSEETLHEVHRKKPDGMTVHIHCGEDRADMEYCRELGYSGPVDRLFRFGLLNGDSILAHAVHLSEEDYHILRQVNPVIVSNAESNANNRVGQMDLQRIKRCVLGTDGMSGDMVSSLRSHFILASDRDYGRLGDTFFKYKTAVQRKFFPGTGSFETGAAADIAVLNYAPVSPIDRENLIGHIIFGARGGCVFMTVSNGKVLFQDGKITFADEENLVREGKKAADRLYRRYYG